jgi:hypothetical protein
MPGRAPGAIIHPQPKQVHWHPNVTTPFHQFRLSVLLFLQAAAAWLLIGILHDPPPRHPTLLDILKSQPTVSTLITFQTPQDSDFRQLPPLERHRLVSQRQQAILKAAGIRHAPRLAFSYSRGMVIDLNRRQLHRISRQNGLWSIEVNHNFRYEAQPGLATSTPLPSPPLRPPQNDALKIAVIDSGLERLTLGDGVTHMEAACFCSRGDHGCCPNGNSILFGDQAGVDHHGHGTAVTHLLLDQLKQFSDVSVNLVTVKIIDDYPGICCSADIVAAMDWLASQHPDLDIVNISLSAGTRSRAFCSDGWGADRLVSDAANALVTNGTVVVAASGNDGDANGIAPPGCAPGVITVGAVYKQDYPDDFQPFDLGCRDDTQHQDQVTCFSNASRALDLLAPGAYVSAPWLKGAQHDSLRGTSFAAPKVSGCAASLLAAAPSLTAQQIGQLLTQSGTQVTDPRSRRQWPRLDCQVAHSLLPSSLSPYNRLDLPLAPDGGPKAATTVYHPIIP